MSTNDADFEDLSSDSDLEGIFLLFNCFPKDHYVYTKRELDQMKKIRNKNQNQKAGQTISALQNHFAHRKSDWALRFKIIDDGVKSIFDNPYKIDRSK